MRSLLALLLLTPVAVAQTAEEKKATLAFIESLRDKDTGAFKVTPDGKPTLRACNGAAKAIKVLGGELADKDKVSKFVLSCYDEKAGMFADPGTKADVASTAIGVIVACELGIPKDKFKGAMTYLEKNTMPPQTTGLSADEIKQRFAVTFEEVRIAAAAVEAWGVKECPFKPTLWLLTALMHQDSWIETTGSGPSAVRRIPKGRDAELARDVGSLVAFLMRLELNLAESFAGEGGRLGGSTRVLLGGQRPDGGWGKKDAKASDIETTYRVMRALMLLKEQPKDEKKLREFLAAHRNKDGGSATEPGKASSMSGVYYNVIIAKWLDDMAKK